MLDEKQIQVLFALKERGWGIKAIAREMGWARNTVRDWLRRGENAPRPVTGRPGSLADHLGWVRERFTAGIRNADVLRQELSEMGVLVSLRTVERAVEDLRAEFFDAERATLRFETSPGRQIQIDFGEKWIQVAGERVKAFVFVATLGFSRRTFVRVFPAMRQVHWLSGLEAALQHFGGVPSECLVDNAKALVLDWVEDNPRFHKEFEAFCRHWGMKPRACRPYRARTKGKVESGVGYVKANALGRLDYESWDKLDAHLSWWMDNVADVRNHGTTFERPIDRFEREKGLLADIDGHPSYLKTRRVTRKVTGDCRVELDTNRYSVPFKLVGQTVDLEVTCGEIAIRWRGQVVAEHLRRDGRHQDIEDPGHMEGLVAKTFRKPTPNELARPLGIYEAAVGGEQWS